MPPSELQRKLRSLRGHVRRLILLAGASRVAVALVAVLGVSLLLDWAAKLETPGRVVLLAAACLAVLYALWRCLFVPLRVGLGDEALALAVERRFPGLQDRLISTVQFTREEGVDPLSQDMANATTWDTVAAARGMDFDRVATAKPTALWAAGAGLLLVAASLYTMVFPATAAIFASRFFDPFSTVEWPRRTQLTVLAYDKDNHPLVPEGGRIFVPKGEDLLLAVRAARHSGTIWHPPRRVTVRYQFAAGGRGRRNVPMADTATYRTAFPTVTETFTFDVVGDDAVTRPFTVQVRTRPRVEDIRVALRAPDYTGEPERVLPDGRGGITALAGTVATVTVSTNKDIARDPASARIVVDGQPVAEMSFVADGDRRLRGSFVLRAEHKQYAIALLDTVGLTNSSYATYGLDVRPDRAPAVQLPKPGASKRVTPKALVPVEMKGEDDYGCTAARFVYRRGEEGKPVAYDFPKPDQPVKTLEHSHEWDLTALAVKEREVLLVHVEVEDAYRETRDGKALGPNVGKSPVYRLTVISEAEMAALLQRRQQEIKQHLRKLVERQQAASAGIERLAAEEAEPERRQLKLSEREQRKIAASADGLARQLEDVLADMANNKVGNLAERRRAEELAKALDQAAGKNMPEAARQIGDAAQAEQRPEQRKRLAEAAASQRQIADDLRAALARFDQWQDVDELLRDASELLMAQKKLNEQTADLGRKLLGKPADKLTPAEKGAARSLARAQQGARDRMQALESKMADVATKIEAKDPAAAKIVQQALSQATSDQIRGKMGEAADRIQQARPASALAQQAQAAEALTRLVETLSRARSPYLARDIRELQKQIEGQMREVEELLKRERRHLLESGVANLRRQLKQLAAQQAATQAATAKAPNANGLKQQAAGQEGHAQEAKDLGRQLERLARDADEEPKRSLTKAGESLEQAEQQMAQAASSLGKAEQANASQSKTAASKAQEGAMEKLGEAERQLEQLQKMLAEKKGETERLADRAKEQGETAKDTKQSAKGMQKTAEQAKKTFPTTAESVQQASRNAEQAGESMEQAEKGLQQASQKPEQSAPQQQKAQGEQQEAVEDLERAREQLAKAHEELDLRRRVQKLFELQKALTEMLPKQVAVREATGDLDKASEGGGKPFDHAQTLRLGELADAEGKLLADARRIIAELEKEQAPVFLYVMRDTERLMAEVQQRLIDQKPDWMTQEAERDAERNIMELLAALRSEADRLAKKQEQQQGGGGGQGGGKPQPLVAPYHQLKQLKNLQLRANEQTRSVELDRTTRRRLNPRLLKRRAERLATRQAEIGKLSREFGKALEDRNTQESMQPQ